MSNAMRVVKLSYDFGFVFSSRRRHTRYWRDWSSDVCSSDLVAEEGHLGEDVAEVVERRRGRDRRQAVDLGPLLEGAGDHPQQREDRQRRQGDEQGEIGRASCRERSVDLGGRRIIKKKNRASN